MDPRQCQSEEENKKKKCCKKDKYIDDFLDDNTIAGINHVFKGRSKFRRMMWGLILISSIVTCLVLISYSIAYFMDRPTASTINIITLDAVPFPSVTICNINFEKNESNKLIRRTYNIMNQLFNADEKFHTDSMFIPVLVDSCRQKIPTDPQDEHYNVTIWDIQKPTGFRRRFIYYCGFVDGVKSNVSFCEDYFEPILTPAGICFTFNGSDKLIRSTGTRYGMKLVLNIEKEKRPSYNGKSGVILSVHDGKDVARPNVNGINVAPGQALNVGVNLRLIRDNTNEANCTNGKKLPFFEEYEYSDYACSQNALNTQIARRDICNCIISPVRPSHGQYTNTPNCTFPKACCLIREYVTFNSEEQCPLPCSYRYYDYTTSYSSFPNGFYLEKLTRSLNESADYVKENFLSINIYINDLHYTRITTKYTFSVEALLGEIGGQLGLFIGVSIITFFEVLVLCLDEFKRICCIKRIKERIKKIKRKNKLDEIGPEHELMQELKNDAKV